MEYTGSVGPKAVITGKQAVCSSSHPIVTETMVSVMQYGGNAADAAVADSLVQAVVEPHMTNHAGSAVIQYWEASTGKAYHLNGHGMELFQMCWRDPKTGLMNSCADLRRAGKADGF